MEKSSRIKYTKLNNKGITQKDRSSTVQNMINEKEIDYSVNREYIIDVKKSSKKDLILDSKSIKKNKSAIINVEKIEENLDEIILSGRQNVNYNDNQSNMKSKSFNSEANIEIEDNLDKEAKENFSSQSNIELGNQILNSNKLFNHDDYNFDDESEYYDKKYMTGKNRAHFNFDEINIAKFNSQKKSNKTSK